MGELESQPGTVNTPETCEPRDIVNFILNSFYFSRGYDPAQRAILGYLAYEYAHRLSPKVIDEALDPAVESVYSAYNNWKGHPVNGMDVGEARRSVEGYIEKLKESLELSLKHNYELLPRGLLDLATELIYSDWKWTPEGQHSYQPTRQYRSNIVVHGVLGRPTGREGFDGMFQKVAGALASPSTQIKPIALEEFNEVVNAHILIHPDDAGAVGEFRQAIMKAHGAEDVFRAA